MTHSGKPRKFSLDPWAKDMWEWQRGRLYWPISFYEYDRMEPRVIAGPHGFSASACDLVVGPVRTTAEDAKEDLEILMGDLLPHAGTNAMPIAAIHAWREIALRGPLA